MNVLTIFGTRPEAIKLAPVIRVLRERDGVSVRVCVTGQHRGMIDQALDVFGIVPDHDLAIMTANQTPTSVAAKTLIGVDDLLAARPPDWVVVQGDTTSVAAAALAAFYRRVPVAHVEAGLRTNDRQQPFPEEINRRLTTVLADLHLAPTATAAQNLRDEGVPVDRIVVTGNPVIDALRWAGEQSPPSTASDLLSRVGARRLILVTAHRRENFGAPLRDIVAALRDLAVGRPDICFVCAVHPNPNIRPVFEETLDDLENVVLAHPLGYVALVHVMRKSDIVVTDSGGLQEEAPSLGIPVLVLRNVTERPEAVDAGTVRVVGTERNTIIAAVTELLEDPSAYARMAQARNPYGDGRASERIAAALMGEPVDEFAYVAD